MSQEAVDALRANFDQFARGDFSAYVQLPDEFELVTAPEMPDAGTYRGEAGRRWLAAWVESFDRLTLEATEFIDAGDRVFIELIQRGAPRDGGIPMELRTWSVTTVRDGIVARIELFLARSPALAAAGIAE